MVMGMIVNMVSCIEVVVKEVGVCFVVSEFVVVNFNDDYLFW